MNQNNEEDLEVAGFNEAIIEMSPVEFEPKIEQKEMPKNYVEAKSMRDKEVKERIETIEDEGRDLKSVLKGSEANAAELAEYEEGEERIEDEAAKEKKDYEDSLLNIGDEIIISDTNIENKERIN